MVLGIRHALAALAALAAPAVGQDDGRHLFTIQGEAYLDQLGAAVAPAGDLDADGREDFLVAAPAPGTGRDGYVSVRSGRDGLELLRVAGPPTTDSTADQFGAAVAGLGDLDLDGTPDFAVGAPRADHAGEDSGSVYVYSGADGSLLHRFDGLAAGDRLGDSVAAAGDVDGDGRPDLAAGAPGGGYARAWSGEWIGSIGSGSPPVSTELLLHTPAAVGLQLSVAGLGDVDRDGFDNVGVGSPDEGGAGVVRVVSGETGNVLLVLAGDAPGDRFGVALAPAGDLDGDRYPDVLVGAQGSDVAAVDAGLARALSGEWIAKTAVGGSPSTALVLRELRGLEAGDGLGATVSGGLDLDLDGTPDLVAGALDGAATPATPYARAWSGATGAVLFTVVAEDGLDRTGWSAALAPDVNGDGHADLLVGSPRGGSAAQGFARAMSGKRLLLTADTHVIELGAGGTMTMSLDADPAFAGQFYVMLGSASGVSPGLPTPVGLLPINFDGYTVYVLNKSPELKKFVGFLDPAGDGTARVVLGPGTNPGIVGLKLDYAYVVLDVLSPVVPATVVSNAVPLRFELDDCVAVGGVGDCDGNGVLDACEIAAGAVFDCDGNGVPDTCDLASGTLSDADLDGIPDVCTTIVFVDAGAPGSGNGTSWGHAFNDLRNALAAAPDFAQIWVAEGTYRPWPSSGNRAASFELRDTVGVYGGFAGTEFQLSQRDPLAHPTTLSGDLLADDASGGNAFDNAYNVVEAGTTVGPTAVLDGFTIIGGFANETGACNAYDVFFQSCIGGGLLSIGSPTVRGCRFVANFGGHRGGAVWASGYPTFERCVFEDNAAFRGAGVFVDLPGEPLFVDCVFRGNEGLFGAGVFVFGNEGETARFVGCVFDGNLAVNGGGALHAEFGSALLELCTLAQNQSTNGPGGVTLGPVGSVTLRNSIVWGNTGAAALFSNQLSGAAYVVDASTVQGWAGQLPGSGNHGLDPQFANPKGPNNQVGDSDDDLRPVPGSPAVDSGDTSLVPADILDLDGDGDTAEPWPTDLDGGPRVADQPATPNTGVPGVGGAVVDRGAYEG